jgi:UDP-N-acetyl-D-galactosamine dehydrogenase
MTEKLAVIGLGYVGLPVLLAFAKQFPGAIGFDIDEIRVAALKKGEDKTGECDREALLSTDILFTSATDDLKSATFFVVAVPTPIDSNRQPDLRPLSGACQTVGVALKPGDVVVVESTVYPGITEDVCGPILAEVSGLTAGVDFHLGYSPERINPGDREHTIETIVKVVSGDDDATLERVANAYAKIVKAGVHRAPSIKTAEAAKVIENTQRDLNIALFNELALIFDRLDIRTQDVLEAAATKWNFLRFSPGLVGGHCIGVDPYYLTAIAESVGYHPQVILAGRRTNDAMGSHIAQRLVKMLARSGNKFLGARVGILGMTFKENVPDLRNSKVPDIITELQEFNVDVLVHDPIADAGEVQREFGLGLSGLGDFRDLDGLVIAVPHEVYAKKSPDDFFGMLRKNGALIDVKSLLDPSSIPTSVGYWSL